MGDKPAELTVSLLPLNEKDVDSNPTTTVTVSKGGATTTSAIFNLTNTIVGTGVLSLPAALKNAGWIQGMVLMLAVCIASTLSFKVLVSCCELTGKFTYKEVGILAYGPRMGNFTQIIIFIYTLGTLIAYPIFVGDFMNKFFQVVAPNTVLTNSLFIVPIFGIFFLIPISLLKNLNALRYFSVLAISCVVYLAVVIIIELTANGVGKNIIQADYDFRVFVAFPVISVAFTAHYNVLSIYEEMEKRNKQTMNNVIHSSMVFCFLLYTTIGICGYFMFGELTEGNVLNTFQNADVLAIIARLALSITVIFSYPLVMFAARRSAQKVFFPKQTIQMERKQELLKAGLQAGVIQDQVGLNRKVEIFLHYGLTIILGGITLCIAAFIAEVDKVFAFNGSIFGAPIVYIFPGLFYIKLKEGTILQKWRGYLLIVFGVLLAVLGFTGT